MKAFPVALRGLAYTILLRAWGVGEGMIRFITHGQGFIQRGS